jgi:hypothetical protein
MANEETQVQRRGGDFNRTKRKERSKNEKSNALFDKKKESDAKNSAKRLRRHARFSWPFENLTTTDEFLNANTGSDMLLELLLGERLRVVTKCTLEELLDRFSCAAEVETTESPRVSEVHVLSDVLSLPEPAILATLGMKRVCRLISLLSRLVDITNQVCQGLGNETTDGATVHLLTDAWFSRPSSTWTLEEVRPYLEQLRRAPVLDGSTHSVCDDRYMAKWCSFMELHWALQKYCDPIHVAVDFGVGGGGVNIDGGPNVMNGGPAVPVATGWTTMWNVGSDRASGVLCGWIRAQHALPPNGVAGIAGAGGGAACQIVRFTSTAGSIQSW